MRMDPVQLRDFAKRYTAAWCSQDAQSVAAFFAPSGSLSVNGVPAVGRRAIADIAQGFMAAFPDMQLHMDEVLLKGGRVEYHWTLIGTNSGPGGTGHRMSISGFEEWEIGVDGLIANSQGHFDGAAYQQQLQHGFQESQQ